MLVNFFACKVLVLSFKCLLDTYLIIIIIYIYIIVEYIIYYILSRLEKELFSDDIRESTQSNLSAEEWKALRGLAADKTFVRKGTDKGSSVVVWDRCNYLHEASRQLEDQNIYENVKFNENILTDLLAKTNKIFKRLCSRKLISEKELKYFTYNFKKATNLGKLYFLPKIHKRLSAVPGRPVISNCRTPTENVSEY